MEFLLRIEGSEDGLEEPQNVESLENVIFDEKSGEWKILFYNLQHILAFSRTYGQVKLIASDEGDEFDIIVISPLEQRR